MEDRGRQEVGEDEDIAKAIVLAATAGGLRICARLESRAKFGDLLRDAAEHSAAATALLDRWIARQPSPAAGLPMREKPPIRPDRGPLA